MLDSLALRPVTASRQGERILEVSTRKSTTPCCQSIQSLGSRGRWEYIIACHGSSSRDPKISASHTKSHSPSTLPTGVFHFQMYSKALTVLLLAQAAYSSAAAVSSQTKAICQLHKDDPASWSKSGAADYLQQQLKSHGESKCLVFIPDCFNALSNTI